MVTHAALFDELEKISTALGDERRGKVKKFLKNTALLAGGAGAGAIATTAIDKVVGTKIAPHLNKLNPTLRKAVIGGLLGLTFAGGQLASKKLTEERMKTHE